MVFLNLGAAEDPIDRESPAACESGMSMGERMRPKSNLDFSG
eukprot:COSAG02_NODE_132_length_34701_cov_707.955234_11_plen_42_part_00